MFRPIQIEREIDDLNKTVYNFHMIDHNLYLQSVIVLERPSKRHKWQMRQDLSYDRIDRRNYGIKEEPEIDIDVQADAVQEARNQITFKLWRRK